MSRLWPHQTYMMPKITHEIIAISQRIKKIVEYNEIRDQLDNRLNFFVIKAVSSRTNS